MDHSIAARRSNLVLINKEKRICHLVNFTDPSDHGVEIKVNEEIVKNLDLTRELKKL